MDWIKKPIAVARISSLVYLLVVPAVSKTENREVAQRRDVHHGSIVNEKRSVIQAAFPFVHHQPQDWKVDRGTNGKENSCVNPSCFSHELVRD